eukprot:gene4899-17448_t
MGAKAEGVGEDEVEDVVKDEPGDAAAGAGAAAAGAAEEPQLPPHLRDEKENGALPGGFRVWDKVRDVTDGKWEGVTAESDNPANRHERVAARQSDGNQFGISDWAAAAGGGQPPPAADLSSSTAPPKGSPPPEELQGLAEPQGTTNMQPSPPPGVP